LVNDLINIIIDNIKKGDFILKNIGSFKIKDKKERIGRNPKTGKEFIISSRRSISFTPSKKITQNLNE
jgi:integration host factor subunit alpha